MTDQPVEFQDGRSDQPASESAVHATVIIEDGVIPPRVRRPLDLARFLLAVALTFGTVGVAWFASSTSAGLDADLSTGARLLPSLIILVLNVVGGIGTLGLPIAASVSLVIRKRLRQLLDSFIASLFTIVLLTALAMVVTHLDSPRLLTALTGSASSGGASTAPILGGLIAFITVARLMGRRPWSVLSVVIIGSVAIVTVLSSAIALAGMLISITIGWGVGLIVRYAFGTPTSRPSGVAIAQALELGGYPVISLVAQDTTRRGRRYQAVTRIGAVLRVTVFDRDMEGAGLATAAWTALRLREDQVSGRSNMRRTLDHAALTSYAAEAAGAAEPRLLLASEINADSYVLAYEFIEGSSFAQLDELTDADLEQAWRALRTLHERHISHRSLHAEHIIRGIDGSVWLVGQDTGSVAATDVAMRIDLAEMLCTLALLAGADRAIATGRTVLGVAGLSRTVPALQTVALSAPSRKALRRHKDLLVELRNTLIEIGPDDEVKPIQLQRIKPRTLILAVVGTVAGYVLLTQLADVDLVKLITTADWRWAIGAVLFSVITYLAAAWSLSGFVPERLSLHRTVLAQLSGAFATLVSPPTLGSVAINMRFLQKAGVHPALAAASVAVSQVMAFVMHMLLLLAFGLAAGTQADFTFQPPRIVVIAVVVIAVIIVGLFAIPQVRRLTHERIGPLLREVGPRLITVAQRPLKLLEGIGGILVLNFAFIAVLYASIEAFGGDLSIAVVAVVYLAGATIGQAAPTPGGLGAVEAALTAGLTAAGLDGGVALSAVLLYRVVTFWIPTIPGYWAFSWLTKRGAL
ncbi:MAG: lysylphosphatidylglycerol synthase transmembrane domain-containing protein [Actinomycetota bacterium]|nr:lysylphosphatidylglycerol synthase transmembrane domain-containing protein [Actinomycetota bacterium]